MGQKLGQHFLKNKEKIRKIADSLRLEKGEFVVEIGPGHGELTDELRIRNRESKIVGIEKDTELAEALQKKFSNSNVEIIHGDALKLLSPLIKNSKLKIENSGYKVAGNIPYYITGHFLRTVGELEPKPEIVVITIQKEVAERVCAKPPQMNLLAASVQFWADAEIIDRIPRKDFDPPPKVDSAIIKLRIKNHEARIMGNYYEFVKILFRQPRKTILNNLANGLKKEKDALSAALKKLGINPLDRPQNLGVAEIIKLSAELKTESSRG